MLKEDVFVEVKVTNYKNVKYYNNLGYVCKLGDTYDFGELRYLRKEVPNK